MTRSETEVRTAPVACHAPAVDDLLGTLETYYDAAPRPSARTEEVGPFTLFLQAQPGGWPYYARARLGLDRDITVRDVEAVARVYERVGFTRVGTACLGEAA